MKFIILAILLLCILLFTFFLLPRRNRNRKGAYRSFDWRANGNKSIFSIIDTIEYVILEDSPENSLQNIDKVIEKNGKYYVFDYKGRNRIFVYDLSGKFLFHAGGWPEIPEKQANIRNFTVSRDHIYLLANDRNTLMILDADGNFVTQKDLPFTAQDIAICGNGNFIFSWYPLPKGDFSGETHKIIVTDPNIRIKQSLRIGKDEFSYGNGHGDPLSHLIFRFGGCFQRSKLGIYVPHDFKFPGKKIADRAGRPGRQSHLVLLPARHAGNFIPLLSRECVQ